MREVSKYTEAYSENLVFFQMCHSEITVQAQNHTTIVIYPSVELEGFYHKLEEASSERQTFNIKTRIFI